jgi:hypothetical protein
MSIIGSNILAGASGQAGGGGAYEISRSVRFNSSDSAYLSKNLSTGSTTAWSFSVWVKKSLVTTSTDYRGIFTARSAANNYAYLDFSDNGIRFANRPPSGTIAVLQTTPVFRDPSAWFHVLLVYDSANATSTDTLRLYVNGTRITTFSSATYPSASQASIINSGVAHYIGFDSQNTGYLDGYLGDAHFIDSQALTPSAFGEFDTNNVWQPIDASGLTYGTNGFHLPFSDNSTAAALGTDTSGNGNDWTPNNLSVDSPTALPVVNFDGSGDALSLSLASGGVGSGNFTLEYFVYHRTLTNYQTHFGVSRGSAGFNVGTDASGDFVWYDQVGSFGRKIEVIGAITTGRWYHWAFVRSGTTITGYLNGVAQGTYSSSANYSGTTCRIGDLEYGGESTNGVISNFRLVVGTALYTSAFTPPSAPLANVTNTQLLCCQSGSSATAATVAPGTITAVGDAYATTFTDSKPGNDSLVDSPTNGSQTDTGVGGEVVGNYATLNPLWKMVF